VQADGKVLIGGVFTSYNGTSRNFIARLNSDGSLDTSFDPGTGPSSGVYSVAVQADGKILIGGGFASYNGTSRNFIARLNSDGSLDTSFDSGSGASSAVYSVAVQADGKVYIGGYFLSYNGKSRRNIARINSDGSLDTSFSPSYGPNSTVLSFAMQADGKVLIGGEFTSYDGKSRNRIARLNSDGSLDTSFNPGTGANKNSVTSIALQADGKVLIGGRFTSYNGTPRNYSARLNSDGSLDTTFDPGAGASDVVSSTVLQADGKVLIGGWFLSYNGTARNRLARLHNDPATQTISVPSAGQVRWLRGGTAPEIEQASFEHSADGFSWSALGIGTRITSGWELTNPGLSATGYIRARGRTTAGSYQGGSSVIEQVASYSNPAGGFDAWTAAAGLTGPDAAPGAAPHGDGVPNVLKYAFNMNGSGSDTSVLVAGTGTNGLPVFALATGGPSSHFRCEFIRRIASELIYTPKKSTNLSPQSWLPLTDSPTVLPINANWERVIYEEPCDPVTTPKCFYRVDVTLP
jgi:uncharacterized delta-60 repeat protein